MLMLIVIALTVIGFVVMLIRLERSEQVCPECGANTITRGHEGWKKSCTNCDWDNFK